MKKYKNGVMTSDKANKVRHDGKFYIFKEENGMNNGVNGVNRDNKVRHNGRNGHKMMFSDLCVSREIKALDRAWDNFVENEYTRDLNCAGSNAWVVYADNDTDKCGMEASIERIERARELYLKERNRLKDKFSANIAAKTMTEAMENGVDEVSEEACCDVIGSDDVVDDASMVRNDMLYDILKDMMADCSGVEIDEGGVI